MTQASLVLLAVATELSELAKTNMPALRTGETVQSEWFKDATFYRKTKLDGQTFIAQFSFTQRKSHRMLVKGGNKND